MSSLRPIPLALLGDSMEVLDVDGTVSRTVGNVRLVLKRNLNSDKYVARTASEGTVYVDARNSAGAYEVAVGACVRIGGERFVVAASEALAGLGGEVHHWELAVRSLDGASVG